MSSCPDRMSSEAMTISRRNLLLQLNAAAPPQRGQADSSVPLDFSGLPNCCSHEHWGSVSSIGRLPGGHRADFECGALPGERTGLLDLVVDPYFRNWATRGGANFDELVADSGVKFDDYAKRSSWDAWCRIQPVLRRHQFAGVVQCVRRGVLKLYGSDLLSLDQRSFASLSEAIGSRYAAIFGWYRSAMRQAHFSDLSYGTHFQYIELRKTSPVMERRGSLTLTYSAGAREASLPTRSAF